MISKSVHEPGGEDKLSLPLSPKAMSINSAIYFVLFLGTALLLKAHLELWVVPLNSLLSIFKRNKKPIFDKNEALVSKISRYFIVPLFLIMYYFLVMPLLRPPIGETIKNIALIYYLFFTIILGFSVRKSKTWMRFLGSIMIFSNILLWKLRLVHRKELVWLIAAESLVFLIAGIISFYTYMRTKDAETPQLSEEDTSAQI